MLGHTTLRVVCVWRVSSNIWGPDCRDGHDTDTKYRYCRYLRVGVKYRYFHQVSLVFNTEPALFMVACMYENLKKMSIKVKKSRKMQFFSGSMFD